MMIVSQVEEQFCFCYHYITVNRLPSRMMNHTDLEFLTETPGSGRSGSLECNDITSVFAFLAFLFALLNFVVNMGGGRRRRRRSVEEKEEQQQCYLGEDQLEDPLYRSSLLSVHALCRGVLNYLDLQEAEEAGCGARVLCEAGREAARGELGPVIAVLGSHRAGWMLESRRVGSHRATVRAVTRGAAGLHCHDLYPCLHQSDLDPGQHSQHSGRARAELERIRLHVRQLSLI